jgi:hypothetical protein
MSFAVRLILVYALLASLLCARKSQNVNYK